VGWVAVDWIGLAQDRDKWRALVNTVMDLRVAQNARKLSSGHPAGGLSSSAQLYRVCSQFMSSILALRPTQPPVQWVLEAFSLEAKRQGREADHST
jgi:hypothetical protein